MCAKWLIILVLALSPMAAVADPSVSGVEAVAKVEAKVKDGERSSLLKSLQERARLDKNSGLRFNVMEFEGGFMKALGFSSTPGLADTEIYITGPYVHGRPGMGFEVRW